MLRLVVVVLAFAFVLAVLLSAASGDDATVKSLLGGAGAVLGAYTKGGRRRRRRRRAEPPSFAAESTAERPSVIGWLASLGRRFNAWRVERDDGCLACFSDDVTVEGERARCNACGFDFAADRGGALSRYDLRSL